MLNLKRSNSNPGNFEVVVLISNKMATKLLDKTILKLYAPSNIAKIYIAENVRTAGRVKKKKSSHYRK